MVSPGTELAKVGAKSAQAALLNVEKQDALVSRGPNTYDASSFQRDCSRERCNAQGGAREQASQTEAIAGAGFAKDSARAGVRARDVPAATLAQRWRRQDLHPEPNCST